MKNTINKVLITAVFGLILSASAMAGEDVDAFTLSFQNNNDTAYATDVHISKASYAPGIVTTHSVLAMCYDSVK